MRKPRDFDSELTALAERSKQLRARKVQQLGELVMACSADALPVEQLTGALLAACKSDAATKEAWRKAGAAFFQGSRGAAPRSGGGSRGDQAGERSHEPPAGGDRA